MSAAKVLVTCKQMQNVFDAFADEFRSRDVEVHLPELVGQQFDEAEMIELIRDADGVIAGDDVISGAVMDAGEKLRIIAKWGVGVDAIDLAAAQQRGIPVRNTPGVFGEDVADAALGLLLAVTRGIAEIDRAIRDGEWRKIEGMRLAGRTAGVLGFGSIGQATARRLVAFGCPTLAYDPVPQALTAAADMQVTGVALEELFARSDVLVLCAPLTPETHHVVNAESLATMPKGALLVNVSRGTLVDEDALIAALSSGHLAGAGLDVFRDEPLPADSPLRTLDRCVLGSHNGSNTREGVLACSAQAVRNVLEGLDLA